MKRVIAWLVLGPFVLGIGALIAPFWFLCWCANNISPDLDRIVPGWDDHR